MDDLFTLIVIFLIVAPLLEKMFKGARGAPQKPQPRPRGRSQPAQRQRLPDGRTTTVSRPAEGESRDASDLLPADLWQILTGQRPQPTLEEAPEKPLEARPVPVQGKRMTLADRQVAAEKKRAERLAREDRRRAGGRTPVDEEAAATELMRSRERTQAIRRQYDHDMSPVVSLEADPLAEEARHAAFHDRLDRLPKAATVRRGPGVHFDLDLDDPAALKRAILIQEVFGRPKGLD